METRLTQINAPKFPHLVDHLEFLADAVEDAIEGAYKELPYVATAQAVFALLYAHKKMGIIPDSILELGRADDSSVVRAVLIQNEKAFSVYANTQGISWEKSPASPKFATPGVFSVASLNAVESRRSENHLPAARLRVNKTTCKFPW